jgi:hypothetical protein
MALPKWELENIFKPLNMSRIHGFPHGMPKCASSKLSKFSTNDVTKEDYHLSRFYDEYGTHKINPQHSYVIMRLFFSSLIGDARAWYNNLPRKSINIWEDFERDFMRK